MIKNSILIILGLFLIHSNSSEAFLWGLTQEEKSICRNRASRENNEFSAKKAYKFCKNNTIKKMRKVEKEKAIKEKKYQYCISPYSKTIKDSKDKKKLAKEKAWKEVNKELENNPIKECQNGTGNYLVKSGKHKGKLINLSNCSNAERKIKFNRTYNAGSEFDLIIYRIESKCRKKAGYR